MIEPQIHTNTIGSNQSREQSSADLITTLRAQHPTLNRDDFCKEIVRELAANIVVEDRFEGVIREALRLFAFHKSNAVFRKRHDRVARGATLKQLKVRLADQVEERAKTLLLDMAMPNGKQLRDCTGADCERMSQTVSPWLARLARRVRPRQHVGSVFNEEQVKALYETSGLNHNAK